MVATATVAKLRVDFFSYLFGDNPQGYICIAIADPNKAKTSFKQHFFNWPRQKNEIATFIEQVYRSKNVWFCTSLLNERKRNKEACIAGNIVWADLDIVTPDECKPKPTAAIKSSPGRYQGYWRLDVDSIPPDVQEDYSRKIAYNNGADKSGWDLTQLLRVPFTKNFKYPDEPEVELIYAAETRAPVEIFEHLPDPVIVDVEVVSPLDEPVEGMPDLENLPDYGSILYKYEYKLRDTGFHDLFSNIPHESEDWSALMWRLIMVCFEGGMNREEVMSITTAAKCNKYVRDNRPASYLWREVVKGEGRARRSMADNGVVKPLIFPTLVDYDDAKTEIDQSLIGEYKRWACVATDAIEEYHELCGFIMLSATVASGLYLDTSWGELAPNLWGLVLGDSTLTRKTTAMNMAKDILLEIDPEILMATDGSAEGIVTRLADRPNRTSMFFRDEVTGFFDAINKKDYLANMPELMTQLYDVPKLLIRQLRKETITIEKPYFIFFGGGIKDKVHQLLTEEYILSGFLPRFLVVYGDTDLSRIRRTGPATALTQNSKFDIMDRVKGLYGQYNQSAEINILGQIATVPRRFEAKLTNDAWEQYGDFEDLLTKTAAGSPNSMLALPTFTRLGFSLLKMSMILAACENEPDTINTLKVEKKHVTQAAWFIQKWGRYSVQMIENTGLSFLEKNVQKMLASIKRHPGATKSFFMQTHKFQSREVNDLLQTLVDRGLIRIEKEGNGLRLWPIGSQ